MPLTVPDEFSLLFKLIWLLLSFKHLGSYLDGMDHVFYISDEYTVFTFNIYSNITFQTYSQSSGCTFDRVSMTAIHACARDFKSAGNVAIPY